MSTTRTIPTLRLPGDGWEERVQITWIAPAEFISVEGQTPRPTPRSNIVLSLARAESASSPAEARDNFLKGTQAAVPGLTVVGREDEVGFADGQRGSLIVVEFQASSDTRLRQTHLFRIDENILAQLVITVDADAVSDEQEADLRKAALGYAPATG
jgi:hypothetical protein